MFNKNVFTQTDAVADLIKGINEADYKAKMEALRGNQHKIDKNKNGKVDAHDFKILRGEKKPVDEGSDSKEKPKVPTNNPFDVKNYKSQIDFTKPGEKAGFDSKKISTGTVYTRKPVKDESMKKEEVDQIDELKKTTVKSYMNKKVDRINKDSDLQYPFKPKSISNKEAEKNSENLMRGHARMSGVKPTSEEVEQINELGFYERSPEMTHHKLVNGQPKVPSRVASGHIHLHHISGTANSDNAKYKVLAVHEKSPLKAKVGSTISGTKVNDHMDDGSGGHVHVHSAKPDSDFMNEDYEQINELEFTIEDVENFMQTEEYEQLDELSKNLVHRYYGKAIRSHAAALEKDFDIGDEHQKIKRLMAKTNKGAQLGSRNKNPIHHPEVQKHLKAASDAVAKMREPAKKEMAKREKGIKKAYSKLNSGKDSDGNKVVKATGKLTNKRMYGEEIEELDELSKDTLSSYVDKATDSARTMPGYGTKNELGKKSKRMAAISVATSRIKKMNEEVEELDELSRKTLKSYAKKSEPQAISSLAAAHDKVHQHIDKTGKAPSSEKQVMKIAGKEIMHAAKRTKGLERVQNRLAKEEVEELDERELSKGETAEKERIVKGMKKSLSGFKARYGDKAKSVMYATATARAKKD